MNPEALSNLSKDFAACEDGGHALLSKAVLFDNHNGIKYLLEMKVDVNKLDPHRGDSVLFIPCTRSTKDAVTTAKILLSYGANVDCESSGGYKPLILAIRCKSLDMCRILLQNKADPNQVDLWNFTPLHHAQCLDDSGLIFMKCLIEHGADPFVPYHITENTMLHHAVMGVGYAGGDDDRGWRSMGEVTKAVEGVNSVGGLISPNQVNLKQSHVISPNVGEVRLLLKSQAKNPNRSLINGTMKHTHATALHLAARTNDEHVVELLINAGADLNALNMHQGTPLHNASRDGSAEIVQMLLIAGAKVTDKNEWGDTPLHLAVREKKLDVVRILIRAGADPCVKNNLRYKAVPNNASDAIKEVVNEALD
jgi:ankyrin repeat protein